MELSRLTELAKEDSGRKFFSIAHYLTPETLYEAFTSLRKDASAGVDGVTYREYEKQAVASIQELHERLKDGTYRAQPLRRIYIEKEDGRKRPISIPSLEDKIVQRATVELLNAIFEQDFLNCSYGFRPKRSAHQALEAIRVEANRGRTWVVDADIASFFDSIRSEVLRSALEERISDRRFVKLLMGWLRAGVWTGRTLLYPETGTAQGGVISPLMANVVLHRLDRVWQQHHRRLGEIIRYADDLVILCPTKERAEAALEVLTEILTGLGLSLAPAKTSLVSLREAGAGFDFLGFHHRWVESFTRKGRYFCARWPSNRSVTRAKDRIRSHTGRRLLLLPVEDIVTHLNRFLVGWRGYFRHGNSTTVFHDLDEFTVERLARFISNKHGHHGRRYGLRVLIDHEYLGLTRLVGSVRRGPAHALRCRDAVEPCDRKGHARFFGGAEETYHAPRDLDQHGASPRPGSP